jgi:hypothetical protein
MFDSLASNYGEVDEFNRRRRRFRSTEQQEPLDDCGESIHFNLGCVKPLAGGHRVLSDEVIRAV